VGLYNKGLLVKIWGKVTAVDVTNKFFYIDDGTGFVDGTTLDGNNEPVKGVRVSWAWSPTGKPSILPPAVDWYVSVTGLSGSDTADSGATFYRVLRPRDQNDIFVFNPEDSSDPVIAITNPIDGQISKASGQNTVQLAGTATDADTGVVSVEVKIDSGQWQPATYNAGNHAWSYSWQNPQSCTIWARATDFTGHVATISRDVTVSTVTVKYVRPGGTGTKNGSSWDNAEDKVGDALASATSGTEIWVAQGAYQERITLKSGVALYGGFTATETYREQRNWATNKTILDGSQGGSVVTVPSGATSATAIDGFIIRNGSATYGAGIYSGYSGASATIANNIIRANNASSYGGGLYAYGSTLTIAGNVFVGNTSSYYGGAIYYSNSSGQVVKIANNTIIGNAASNDGGGIYLYSSSADLSVSNNIIAYNLGGGVYKPSGSSPSFAKNDVCGNDQNGKYNYYGFSPIPSTDIQSPPSITNTDLGDWHIASDSPCRDPQDMTVVVPMDRDIDGESRIYNSILDIGADEWNGTDPGSVTPKVYYVSPGGSGNKTGDNWQNAADSVQTAITAASLAGGGEVWVASGTYKGTNGKATLKSFVKLYGGFTIGDTSKSDRNWKNNPTILDANASGSVITITNALGCVVDGFTIRNGVGTYAGYYYYGGGIYCSNAIATIENNIVRANNVSSSGYGGGLGALNSTLIVAGNVFLDNKASYYGGGVYYTSTSGQIANNTIFDNIGSSGAGGVYLTSSSPTLSNNIVYQNYGGGIYQSGGTPAFTKNDVFGNSSYDYSGVSNHSADISSNPSIPNIDWGDWHIASSSPCHDPVGTSPAVSMDLDVDHETRVNGTTIDIGADEWNGTDPTPVTPTVIYVKPGGSDSSNGESWGNAVATVQQGINLAYDKGYCEVWVAAGTYTKRTSDTNVASMKSFVRLYGGFAVNDSSKSDRNWKTNQTILDGGNSVSVVTINNALGCVVDGFIITKGGTVAGSGINCSNATATIMNNVIRGNNAGSYSGGGLNSSNSTLTVAGNVFVDNKASTGGGIYYTSTNGQIANNTIICNAASSDGGGIYLYSGSPILSNNIIASNGGGGFNKYGGSPTFTKNVVYQNSKYDYSGLTAPVTDLILSSGTDLGIPNIACGDWHITSSSPCHDPAGTTLAVSLDKDIDLDSWSGSRINGSTVDIGADEWNGTDPTPVTPTVIYVKPGGNDNNSGESWDYAVATVQKGIDLAYSKGRYEVWVAAGSYAKASLKSFVKVYGGFAVNDSSRSARNWNTNQTILDGGGSGSVVTIGSAVGCVVDGFIIRNGGANNGSGVNCSSAIAIVMNNIVRGNNGSGYYGGGLYGSGSTLTVAGNVFLDNKATYGAGIYYTYTGGQVTSNSLLLNNASSSAGGIYLTYSSPALSNNIIGFNTNGGIYKYNGTPTFAKNDVYGNSKPASWTSAAYSWKTWTQNDSEIGSDLNPDTSDPVITNITWGDWHIAGTSPCRDPQGTTLALPMERDIDSES